MTQTLPLLFIGGSIGFLEIAELVRRINTYCAKYEIIGIVDDNTSLLKSKVDGVEIVGNLDRIHDFPDAQLVFAIGSYKTRFSRMDLIKRMDLPEDRFESLIDPTAIVYPSATIGKGSIVHAGSIIGPQSKIGAFSIITFQAAIGPFCIIDKGAMVTTKATVLTRAHIGKCAFIGAHSCIGENIRIGDGALIGMGTVIGHNIAPGSVVLGNPARTVYRVPNYMNNASQ